MMMQMNHSFVRDQLTAGPAESARNLFPADKHRLFADMKLC